MKADEGAPGPGTDRHAGLPGSGTSVRATILVLVLLLLAALWLFPRVRNLERLGLASLQGTGRLAPLLLVACYVLVTVLFLPCFPLDLAAGAHFGFWAGALWVQVAATIASVVGYLMGRFVVRGPLQRRLRGRPRWKGVGEAVTAEGWRVVLLTRLAPIFPFSLLNGVCGALAIPFREYLPATFLGMLPGTFLSVYVGMVAADLSGASGRPRLLPGHWVLEGVGLACTALVVFLVTRRAHRLLRKRLEP